MTRNKTSSHLDSICIEVMQEKHVDEAISCINTEFIRGDPVALALSLTEADCLVHDTLITKSATLENLSMVAIDKQSGRLVGCSIAKDFVTPSPEDLAEKCPKMGPIIALLGQLEKEYAQKNQVSKGQVRHGLLSAVQQEWRNQGVFKVLIQAALQHAKQRGFQKTLGEVAHPGVQHFFLTKLHHRVVGKVDYQSFLYQGSKVLARISGSSACLLMEGDL